MRVAVIGLGAFGRAHLEAWRARADATVVAVVDPSPVPGVDCVAFASADDLLSAAAEGAIAVDAASVATPNATHAPIATALMAAGIDVLVEKPLAVTGDDARSIAQAAAATGRICLPGHLLRFSRGHRELRALVEAGDLGDVLAISASRDRSSDLTRRYPDEHPMILTGVHDADLAIWLSGSHVTAAAARHVIRDVPAPRLARASLDHASGALSTVEATYLLPSQSPGAAVDRVAVHGTRGSAYLDSQSGLLVAHTPAGTRTTAAPPDHDRALTSQIAHFVECVRGGTPSSIVPLADAVNAADTVAAVAESAHHGGAIVRIRPPA